MKTRREAACGLLAGVAAVVSCATRPSGVASGVPGAIEAGSGSTGRFDQELLGDFERAGTRVFSEEGIPMFLVGEDLGRDSASEVGIAPSSNPLGMALASALGRCAESLPRVRPNVAAEDVGRLVEVLAERDFGSGRGKVRR